MRASSLRVAIAAMASKLMGGSNIDAPVPSQKFHGVTQKSVGFPFHQNFCNRMHRDRYGRGHKMLAIKPSRSKYKPHQGKAEMARRAS